MAVQAPSGSLGLGDLVKDHVRTLYRLQPEGRRWSGWDFAVFFGIPTLLAGVAWLMDAHLHHLDAVLAGVAIITGLLFGLLVHVLGLGIRVADDPRFGANSRVTILTGELRANVAYACGLGLLVTAVLVVGAMFTTDDQAAAGASRWLSVLVIWLLSHLCLTMLMIMRRIRATFAMLS